MPLSKEKRITALISVGFPPQDAVSVVNEADDLPTPITDAVLDEHAVVEALDMAHAEVLMLYATLAPAQYRGLWAAQKV